MSNTPKPFDRVGVSNISQEFAENMESLYRYVYVGMTSADGKYVVENLNTGEVTVWAFVHVLPETKKEYHIKSYKKTMKELLKRGYEWDDDVDGFTSFQHDFAFDSGYWSYCGMKVESIEAAEKKMGFPKWLVKVTEMAEEN